MAPYLSTMRDAGGQRPNASGLTFIADYHEAFIKMMDEAYRIVDQMDPMGALVGDLKMPMEDMQRFFNFAQYEKDRVASESTKATASAATTPMGSGFGTTVPSKTSPIAAAIPTVNDCTNSGIAAPEIETNNTSIGSSMFPAGAATNRITSPTNAPVEPAINTSSTSAMAPVEASTQALIGSAMPQAHTALISVGVSALTSATEPAQPIAPAAALVPSHGRAPAPTTTIAPTTRRGPIIVTDTCGFYVASKAGRCGALV